jgi:hypothetical protein
MKSIAAAATEFVTISSKLGRFFDEVGSGIKQSEKIGTASPEQIQRFLQTAQRCDYRLGGPEANPAAT